MEVMMIIKKVKKKGAARKIDDHEAKYDNFL
jgi:hypothetical protein